MWNGESSDEDEPPQRRQRTFRVRRNFDYESAFEINERFRMSPEKLDELLAVLGPSLERSTARNHALTAKQVMCIGLHWLGNGGQYHGVSDMHGIHKSTVCRVLHQFVDAVNTRLFPRAVDWPGNIVEVVQQFHRISEMPLVIGCVDGTLINIDAPVQNEQQYVDRKSDHSINCMVVCGPDYSFYYVSARWPGSVHDARVLRNSTLYERMQGGWRPIEGAIILGDSGYPLLEWLMTPTGEHLNDHAVVRYNRKHKCTRRIVENSLGILKEKFPCLNYLRVEPTFACAIFKCCVALYNHARHAGVIDIGVNDFQADIEDEEGNDYEDDEPLNVGGYMRLQQIINLFR